MSAAGRDTLESLLGGGWQVCVVIGAEELSGRVGLVNHIALVLVSALFPCGVGRCPVASLLPPLHSARQDMAVMAQRIFIEEQVTSVKH